MAPERFTYGEDASQWADLYLPQRTPGGPEEPKGIVVVIHGGFWRSKYDASLGAPLAQDLAERGWAAWNLEYRRVGNGGGWPATFDDVAAGIDLLAEVPDLELGSVVALGHSAGGHLATWAAARGRFEGWRPASVRLTGVVSQAGVLDLNHAYRQDLGSGAVLELLGRRPGPDDEAVDPVLQIPLEIPVWCVHGGDDDVVPLDQSQRYVDAARAAGAEAELVEVDGDHDTVVDTSSAAWLRTVEILDGLAD